MAFSWGIIGAGDIVRRHVAPAMLGLAGHRIAAITRREETAARQFAAEFAVPKFYTRPEDLVADPDVNAVYIATPPCSHARLTALAAQAGKHVLCEKPISCSSAEARGMIEAAEKGRVRVMICHYQRFNSRHRQIREWLDSGAIGKVVSARINFSSYAPPRAGEWRRDKAQSGGGPLMDLGSHCLDLLMYFCGRIVDSEAQVDSLVWETEVEDTATLLLRFASGAQATVTTHWSARIPDGVAGNAVELWGSEGAVVSAPLFSKDHSGSLLLYKPGGVEDHSRAAANKIHEDVIEHFRQAVVSGGPVLAPAEDALAGIEIIERAYNRSSAR